MLAIELAKNEIVLKLLKLVLFIIGVHGGIILCALVLSPFPIKALPVTKSLLYWITGLIFLLIIYLN